jgi:hypothetical protein
MHTTASTKFALPKILRLSPNEKTLGYNPIVNIVNKGYVSGMAQRRNPYAPLLINWHCNVLLNRLRSREPNTNLNPETNRRGNDKFDTPAHTAE